MIELFNKKLLGIYGIILQLIGFLLSFKEVVTFATEDRLGSGKYGDYYYALIDPSRQWIFYIGIALIIFGTVLILIKEIDNIESK